jgi:hypothetical protein
VTFAPAFIGGVGRWFDGFPIVHIEEFGFPQNNAIKMWAVSKCRMCSRKQ